VGKIFSILFFFSELGEGGGGGVNPSAAYLSELSYKNRSLFSCDICGWLSRFTFAAVYLDKIKMRDTIFLRRYKNRICAWLR